MAAWDDRRIDLAAAHDVLRAGRATAPWLASWLPSTWNEPERWRRALYASAAEHRGGSVKGRPGQGFDLYHDCVLAHLGARRTALVAKGELELEELTFDALHERVSALAGAWLREGVEPGERVAIALPVSIDYAVALLTALKLGLVAAPLPPLGRSWVRSRLERLAPDRVVSGGRFQKMLAPGTEVLPLPHGYSAGSLVGSKTWLDDDAVLRLVSPFGEVDAEPTELSAAVVHEALLRDGWLVYALAAGDRLAAPGFDPTQMQPLALLTAWMAGAAWVELAPSDLEADVKAVAKARVTTLGISRAVRELVLRRGGEGVQPATSWFRSMDDVFDFDRWNELSRALAARKIPEFTLLTNAASGGAHLFAPRSLELAPMRAWPAPGRTFQLSQVGAGTLPALDDSGVYTPLVGEEPDRSLLEVVMARQGDGWTLGGAIGGGREGKTVLQREIAKAAERHPAVRAAAVVVAKGRWMNDAHVVLLLFIEPAPHGVGLAEPVSIAEVKALVEAELGARHVPERVETYALRPRFIDGEVDLAWCRSQYLSGALAEKARSRLFTATARLGWIFGVPAPIS